MNTILYIFIFIYIPIGLILGGICDVFLRFY